MTGELGQLSLCLALALSVVMAVAGLIGARQNASRAREIASASALGFFVFIVLAFGALTYASVTSDFSVANVAANSHTAKPLLYKITGVWGNHEGSMLLWMLVLGLYSGVIAWSQRGGTQLTSAALGVQGLLAVAFLLFILFTSNPFLRIDPPPLEGGPQSIVAGSWFGAPSADALHRLCRAFGDLRLCRCRVDHWVAGAARARAARPFMLMAWIALSAGITLGAGGPYYELGWAGSGSGIR